MRNIPKTRIMIRKIISIKRSQGLPKMQAIIFKLLMKNQPVAKKELSKAKLMARILLIRQEVDSWTGLVK